MTYGEFCKRRRSSNYKVGDKVWFFHVVGFDNCGPKTAIDAGIIQSVEDDITLFYGVRPLSTPEDTFCEVSVLKADMRKFRKNEKEV